jgi:hypothetical protein
VQLPYYIGGRPLRKWGRFFAPIGDGTVKSTDLHMFYSLGIALERLNCEVRADMKAAELWAYLVDPNNCLLSFLATTEDMPLNDSRATATYLQKWVLATWRSIDQNAERSISSDEASMFHYGKNEFDAAFDRECRYLDVFTVMKKGIYDTRLLMRYPEEKLPDRLRKFLPKQTLDDWKEAGRCLAFEVPTACAFHICRGTEALMLGYYEALTKHPWAFPKKDWKIYIEQLGVVGAPKSITTRLDEIRDMDRNAYTHPDKTVSLDEAPVLFELCSGVTFYMCQEIERLAHEQ